jgi:hypothetical protein
MNNPIDHAGWAMEERQFESRLERERFFEFGSSDNERQGAVKKIYGAQIRRPMRTCEN